MPLPHAGSFNYSNLKCVPQIGADHHFHMKQKYFRHNFLHDTSGPHHHKQKTQASRTSTERISPACRKNIIPARDPEFYAILAFRHTLCVTIFFLPVPLRWSSWSLKATADHHNDNQSNQYKKQTKPAKNESSQPGAPPALRLQAQISFVHLAQIFKTNHFQSRSNRPTAFDRWEEDFQTFLLLNVSSAVGGSFETTNGATYEKKSNNTKANTTTSLDPLSVSCHGCSPNGAP